LRTGVGVQPRLEGRKEGREGEKEREREKKGMNFARTEDPLYLSQKPYCSVSGLLSSGGCVIRFLLPAMCLNFASLGVPTATCLDRQ
jgi:hypothetical protein